MVCKTGKHQRTSNQNTIIEMAYKDHTTHLVYALMTTLKRQKRRKRPNSVPAKHTASQTASPNIKDPARNLRPHFLRNPHFHNQHN